VNEYGLYLLSPQAPPWRVEGLLFSFYSFLYGYWEERGEMEEKTERDRETTLSAEKVSEV
jgi:hypothetical protein